MDHLPLPHNPALPPLKVPFVCTEEYDAGPFLTYPQRQGWQISQPKNKILLMYNGAETYHDEKVAFIQTWFYFGLLHEAVGPRYKTADFIEEDSCGEKFLTAAHLERIVKEWTVALVSEESGCDISSLVERCTHVFKCLTEARRISLTIMIYDPIDDHIMVAIAALSEYLLQAIKDVYIHLDMEAPGHIPWRVHEFADTGKFLLVQMSQNGWCPFDIARINFETRRIGLLYYYSNLPPPRSDTDHSRCSASLCVAMQIDPATYTLGHTSKCNDCALLSVDHKMIASILTNGSIPLIVFPASENSTGSKIEIRDAREGIDFVAISHVWAEGLGNPNDNALHGCVLSQVSTLVNKLPKQEPEQTMPFWIDTICVPVRPPELQTLGLNKIRQPYERAKHVLVLDSYLRSIDSKPLSPLEVFARLSCCSWARRLWTLQEGRLAKKIWFQFRDEAVELERVFESFDFTRVPSVVSRCIELEALEEYAATKTQDPLTQSTNQAIVLTRYALSMRSASVATDEALCLSCLLGLDMKNFTNIPPLDRMKVFWSLMLRVPVGLVFSKAPKKLAHPGFHWAPSTFLGLLPDGHWAGPERYIDDGSEARITQSGLLVRLPGYTLHPNLIPPDQDIQTVCKTGLLLQDSESIWFILNLEESWGASSSNLEGSQTLGLILTDPLTGDEATTYDVSTHLGEFNIWSSAEECILARIVESKDGILYTKGERHVIFQRLGEGNQTHLNEAKKCAQYILADEDAIDSEIASPSEEKCKQAAEKRLQDPEFLRVCKAMARHFGRSEALNELIDQFSGRIKEMSWFGNRNVIEKTADDQQWCVD